MRVLVACEESQAVCKEFRRLGHEAYSCDIIPCSGGHPEWHIQQDVKTIINPEPLPFEPGKQGIGFFTDDGGWHFIDGKWDMIIAHPPCTYLTVTGNRWLNCERYGAEAQLRWNNRCVAIAFFLSIAFADCPRIAIENPVGCMSTYYRKPDQIIHPWQFALSEEELTEKQTCLWLKGLPHLTPAVAEKPGMTYHEWVTPEGKKKRQSLWYYNTRCLPHSQRATAASKTFPGIARAMAEQWGGAVNA